MFFKLCFLKIVQAPQEFSEIHKGIRMANVLQASSSLKGCIYSPSAFPFHNPNKTFNLNKKWCACYANTSRFKRGLLVLADWSLTGNYEHLKFLIHSVISNFSPRILSGSSHYHFLMGWIISSNSFATVKHNILIQFPLLSK